MCSCKFPGMTSPVGLYWLDIEIIEEPQLFHKIDIHHPSVRRVTGESSLKS